MDMLSLFSDPEWQLEVGATVMVGILLLVSLAIAIVLYLKYSESGTYRVQVYIIINLVSRVLSFMKTSLLVLRDCLYGSELDSIQRRQKNAWLKCIF